MYAAWTRCVTHAVRCTHVHESRSRVAQHVRYLHARGADVRRVADMITDGILGTTQQRGKLITLRACLWKCIMENYGDRSDANHDGVAQRTGGATNHGATTATSTTRDQPVFARSRQRRRHRHNPSQQYGSKARRPLTTFVRNCMCAPQ